MQSADDITHGKNTHTHIQLNNYFNNELRLLIIKITIFSIVIGLKTPIHLPSCYRTVQQTNHIQTCCLNQPITFKVVAEIIHSQSWFQSL